MNNYTELLQENPKLLSFFKGWNWQDRKNNKSQSDKCEEVINLFISWTLRCTKDAYINIDLVINEYAKRFLFALIKKRL